MLSNDEFSLPLLCNKGREIGMFFPETTSQDLRKSVLVTLLTSASIFLPSVFGFGGLFTQSLLGIASFVVLLLHDLALCARSPNRTKDSIVEVITYPYKTMGVLFLIIAVAWAGMHIFNFQRVPARIFIVMSSSIFEFISIYNAPLYLSILINFLFKRTNVESST